MSNAIAEAATNPMADCLPEATSVSALKLETQVDADALPMAGFVAGVIAGVARVVVGHPFDTAKVLTQTGQAAGAGALLRPSLASFFRLYRGVSSPLLTTCMTTGTSFGLYETARIYLKPCNMPDILEVWCAGTLSGAALGIPFCPLANVRVLQQTSSERRNVASWLQHLWSHNGLRGWFRGLAPNLVQGAMGRGFYMATFHAVKDIEDSSAHYSSDSFTGKLIAASSAGIAGWVITYPADVVRSNIIRDWQSHRFSGAMLPAFLQLYRDGGVRKLYAGIGYTVLRALPVAAVTLTIYDFTKAFVLRLGR